MDPSEFIVHDRLGPLVLQGYILADRRWRPRREDGKDKRRWTDMVLYRITDQKSPYQYALQITARSCVYHRIGGPCVDSRHRITTVEEVLKDEDRYDMLVSCRKPGCKAPDLDHMPEDSKIAEEVDDHHLFLCSNPADILRKLYRHKHEISPLAGDLLEEAALKDPRLAAAWKRTRRI